MCYNFPVNHRSVRRVVAGAALALAASTLPGALTSSAHAADDGSTLTIVGTTDVSDSGLIQFLTPSFQAAFPQYTTVKYVGQGTGAAITTAETGAASALLVHAASVENQFVGSGFSLEPFGRAVFWGDYVLLGPASDPANVMTGDQHDIVGAFEKIAAAGEAGTANFVSRGNTAGTPIQEHAIWGLTSGVQTCDVSAANGGGTAPSTVTGACPDVISTLSAPPWYHITNPAGQAANIAVANTCNFTGGNCYVFTDRGTFQNLQHQPPGDTNTVPNLTLMTRDNNVPAHPEQNTLLVNSFHAYAVNPDKFDAATAAGINTAGATDFLNWLTSPEGQAQVASYLSAGGDPPFQPDAAPSITTGALPASVAGGKKVTLKGNVANVVPGTPALGNVAVRLVGTSGGSTFQAAKTVTGAGGRFTLSFSPSRSASYAIRTPGITKVEITTLHPSFGDLLHASVLQVGAMKVTGGVTMSKVKAASPKVTISGALAPKDTVKAGKVTLFAAHPGKKLHAISSKRVAVGAARYSETWKLGKGTWRVQMRYSNSGVISPGTSKIQQVTLR